MQQTMKALLIYLQPLCLRLTLRGNGGYILSSLGSSQYHGLRGREQVGI